MTQLSLELSRKSDPETSHSAADRAVTFKARHEGVIFGAIYDAGARGATAKEIAAATGLTDVQVNRRLGAMGERGLIKRAMLTHLSPFKYEQRAGCAVWFKA